MINICYRCGKETIRIKNGKKYMNRSKIGEHYYCNNCYAKYKRRGSSKRKLYEKVEGYCDYCKKEMTTRNNVNGLVVCLNCYNVYRHKGTFKRRVCMTHQERKEKWRIKSRIYNQRKIALERQRIIYIKSLSADELLALVRNDEKTT